MENANIKFVCDDCSIALEKVTEVKSLASLATSVRGLKAAIATMNNQMSGMESTIKSAVTSLPPPALFAEMIDSLKEMKTSFAATTDTLINIQSSVGSAVLSPNNDTKALLKSIHETLLNKLPSENIIAHNNKVIELLNEIRPASSSSPRPVAVPTFSNIVTSKRPPTEIGTTSARNMRLQVTEGTSASAFNFDIASPTTTVRQSRKYTQPIVVSQFNPHTTVDQLREYIVSRGPPTL